MDRHRRFDPREAASTLLTYQRDRTLARHDRVAASTQNQALSSLLFLYRHVLHSPLPWLDNMEHAKRPVRLPTVLTQEEVKAVLGALPGSDGSHCHSPWNVNSLGPD